MWHTHTENHTTSVAKPDTATSTRYTVEAAITEDSSASSEPAMLNSTAHTGTPRKFVLAKRAGISRSLASDHTMREHHHNEHGRPHPGRRMRKPSLHQQPAAVNSEASATAQFSQYRTAMVNAVPGPMNRFAYMWKLPAYGMATDSSPSETITQ